MGGTCAKLLVGKVSLPGHLVQPRTNSANHFSR